MNKTPSILVDTGFEVDQNGVLTEIATPRVVTTLDAPQKITFDGKVINYVPSTSTKLQVISAPNCETIIRNAFKGYTMLTSASFPSVTTLDSATSGSNDQSGIFYGCTSLTSASFPSLTTLSTTVSGNGNSGQFYGCTSLTSISLPSLVAITLISNQGYGGAFYNCTGLESFSAPLLTSITQNVGANGWSGGTFYNCSSLTSVSLPALKTISGTGSPTSGSYGTFYNCTNITNVYLPSLNTCSFDSIQYKATFGNCTSLESVQLGSEGNAVTSLGAYMFKGCTQSNLTITIYTQSGASLAGEPWGATNADIEYEEA